MTSEKRWKVAQGYERKHWQKLANEIVAGALGQLDWYDWKAREFERRIRECANFNLPKDCKILEVKWALSA